MPARFSCIISIHYKVLEYKTDNLRMSWETNLTTENEQILSLVGKLNQGEICDAMKWNLRSMNQRSFWLFLFELPCCSIIFRFFCSNVVTRCNSLQPKKACHATTCDYMYIFCDRLKTRRRLSVL